jgi:dynein heavy chain 1
MDWDHLVNAFEGNRFLPGGATDGRESRHFAFVREFASVVSLLQVRACLEIR